MMPTEAPDCPPTQSVKKRRPGGRVESRPRPNPPRSVPCHTRHRRVGRTCICPIDGRLLYRLSYSGDAATSVDDCASDFRRLWTERHALVPGTVPGTLPVRTT